MAVYTFHVPFQTARDFFGRPNATFLMHIAAMRVDFYSDFEARTYDPEAGQIDPSIFSNHGPDVVSNIPPTILATSGPDSRITFQPDCGPITITLGGPAEDPLAPGYTLASAQFAYSCDDPLNYGFHNTAFYTAVGTLVTRSDGSAPSSVHIAPALLGRPSRHYNRAVTNLSADGTTTTGITFRRSDRPIPILLAGKVWDTPAAGVALSTTAGDNSPSLAQDHRGLLYAAFNRLALGTMLSRSDDDGDSWNLPIMAIPGGTHPRLISENGRMLCAAVTTTGTAPNQVRHITGVYRGPGDAAFSAPFTFTTGPTAVPLAVADDSFGLAFAAEGPDRMALHVLMAGETATSDWWSGDLGRTWTRVPLV